MADIVLSAAAFLDFTIVGPERRHTVVSAPCVPYATFKADRRHAFIHDARRYENSRQNSTCDVIIIIVIVIIIVVIVDYVATTYVTDDVHVLY